MPTVYVSQKSLKFDKAEKKMVERYDTLYRAEEFGRLIYVLPDNAKVNDVYNHIETMKKVLSAYTDEDYLLTTGNPVFTGICTYLCASLNQGFVQFLSWNNREERYIPTRVRLR